MLARLVVRVATLLAMVLSLGGCGAPGVDAVLQPDMAHWVITVDNQSAGPALLAVARDTVPMGVGVGTVEPELVPAGATVDVRFGVPQDRDWAIFVNPGPDRGPLIIASDIPARATGKLPIKIVVGPGGEPSTEVPDLPGWFGN